MSRSMFDRYGGFAVVSKVVGSFYDKVLDSEQVGPYFDDIDMRRQIDHQTKFIASVMGGPASYSNEALRQVHEKYKINRADFDEVARLLRLSLEEFGFEAADVDAVMHEIQSRAGYVISDGAS